MPHVYYAVVDDRPVVDDCPGRWYSQSLVVLLQVRKLVMRLLYGDFQSFKQNGKRRVRWKVKRVETRVGKGISAIATLFWADLEVRKSLSQTGSERRQNIRVAEHSVRSQTNRCRSTRAAGNEAVVLCALLIVQRVQYVPQPTRLFMHLWMHHGNPATSRQPK